MQPPELEAAQVHRPFPPERYLPYLTTNEVAALPKQDAALIVVVAAIEQHGPHLPIATDLILGESLLTLALERTAPATQLWVLPSLAYGRSNEHTAFAGTMTLSQATLGTVIHELAESVARAGFRRLVLFNSHGGNAPVLDYLARDVREATGLMVFHLAMFRTGLAYPQISEQEARWGTHAGEWETSMMLSLTPELVQMDRLEGKGGHAHFEEPAKHEHVQMLGPVMFAWSTHDITTTGAIGDPRPATRERGDDIIRLTVERCSQILAEIAGFEMPIPAGSEGDA
jgi:creatinine amidohydrolase/Fe(II)-dependent formamide hydrolase-like protein